jgi:hypothetical protein
MTNTKKPKLSEIKARPPCLCNWNPPREKGHLLDLVKRLGEALEHLLSQSEIAEFNNMSGTATCELCSEVGETMPTIPHKSDCAVKEARALLEELEK